MEKAQKNFRFLGIMLIVLAILDVVKITLSTITDLVNDTWEKAFSSIDASYHDAVKIFMFVLLGISVVSLLVQVFLAIRAIQISKTPSKATLHLSIAKFLMILNIVLAVIVAISLFSSNDISDDLITLALCFVDACIMYSYLQEGKRVRELA